MRLIGLRFVLRDGSFVSAIVAQEFATKVISDWIGAGLPCVIGDVHPPANGWQWAVNVSDIQAIHTFDPAELQRQQTVPQNPWRGSGL